MKELKSIKCTYFLFEKMHKWKKYVKLPKCTYFSSEEFNIYICLYEKMVKYLQ